MKYRIERDSLGEVQIPEDAYYGIQTARAVKNFPITGLKIHRELVWAYALVKKACAITNNEIGILSDEKTRAIVQASEELAEGKLDDWIVVDPLCGGAGTSINMNINEVIANRATEILGGKKGEYIVHPIDDVNMSQSTNDTFPTAVKLGAIRLLRELVEEVVNLQSALQDKEKEFRRIVKLGRTETQDAVPMTLGQEFSAYADAIARDRWRLYKVEERIRLVNLGGTAIGTGVNAPRKYIFKVIENLRNISGIGVVKGENLIDQTQNADVFVEVHGLLKALASNLIKISNDLRFLSSGPKGGIAELKLPPLQYGSSIMPAKVNPVIPEMMIQVGLAVFGNDVAISEAVASGHLELNPFLPLVSFYLYNSFKWLKNAVHQLAEFCIKGIEPNEEKIREHLETSTAVGVILVPHIGYDKATEVIKESLKTGKPVKKIVVEKGIMSEDEINELLSPENLVKLGY